MKSNYGKIILFGSGETSETGKAIHRHILSTLSSKQNVTILETPAGFQPNSRKVAQDVSNIFKTSLSEFVNKVAIIPARFNKGFYSTNNSLILKPVKTSSFIFMGPGSPTYTIRMLKDSKAWKLIIDRWQQGATLCFSSAAALAIGIRTLPVYEIYKAGLDLYWEKGLNLFRKINLQLTIITHWNNTEGGQDLDTRFCFMGNKRFEMLKKLIDLQTTYLGIDENTALIFDFENGFFTIEGNGKSTLAISNKELSFTSGKFYSLDSINQAKIIAVDRPQSAIKSRKKISIREEKISPNNLPSNLKDLLDKREKLKREKDFGHADKIRKIFESAGYEVRDAKKGQNIYRSFT